MHDVLDLFLRLNLAVAAAVLAVMGLRWPARRLFGPRIAYGLWTLVPLAMVALLVPARVVTVPAWPSPDIAPMTAWTSPSAATPATYVPAPIRLPVAIDSRWLAGAWLLGLAIALFALWRSQARFQRAARAGRAGPAVVGVIAPRIVTPDDFAELYTPRERDVVLAHEAAHVARQDSRINALVALARCIAWFNPMVHLMARWMRIDQEFACDAAVVARFPRARGVYAQALLKAGLAAQPLPFGCHWTTHPLVTRVDLLTRPRPDAMARAAGLVAVGVLALGGAATVWAARPAQLAFAPSHEAVILARAVRNAPAPPAPLKPAPQQPPRAESALTPVPLAEAPKPSPLQLASWPVSPAAPAEPGPDHPTWRVRGAANMSSIAPGAAVRVLATMVDQEGNKLVTDLTAFGSQSLYRIGYIERGDSRLRLFTRVVQQGDHYLVTASLNGSFRPIISGSTELTAGESGVIRLPQGLEVNVKLTARPETAEELAAAQALHGRPFVNVEQWPRTF